MKPRAIRDFCARGPRYGAGPGASDPHLKEWFLKDARCYLRDLAARLGLAKDACRIATNRGGPAVWGEATLAAADLFVLVAPGPHGVLYRLRDGWDDHAGRGNHWIDWGTAGSNPDALPRRIRVLLGHRVPMEAR